jgi:hypothetical protein
MLNGKRGLYLRLSLVVAQQHRLFPGPLDVFSLGIPKTRLASRRTFGFGTTISLTAIDDCDDIAQEHGYQIILKPVLD